MVFSSYQFLVFIVVVFTAVCAAPKGARNAVILVSSFFFYGYYGLYHLAFFTGSILFNYALYRLGFAFPRRLTIAAAIAVNLLVIVYFKYWNFLVFDTGLGSLIGVGRGPWDIVLPLGISFFTFTQIAFQVDQAKRPTHYNLWDYALFVSFFPHLIAGPILHHSEMMPQFARGARLDIGMIQAGVALFAIGLAKKVIVADTIGLKVDQLFGITDPTQITTYGAWLAAIGYSLQLYFDFSGYSDMAVGLAALFGIAMPMNFYSPYKSESIIEFWRRWHMTLSRFLREYVYIPLGGNRKGEARRLLNVFITMTVGGLWHGSGLMFLFWGIYHGLGICVAHVTRDIVGGKLKIPVWIGVITTSFFVMNGWILFRSSSLDQAQLLWSRMYDIYHITLPEKLIADLWIQFPINSQNISLVKSLDYQDLWSALFVATCVFGVYCLPNSVQIMGRHYPGFDLQGMHVLEVGSETRLFVWRSVVAGATIGVALMLINRGSPFLYFQF